MMLEELVDKIKKLISMKTIIVFIGFMALVSIVIWQMTVNDKIEDRQPKDVVDDRYYISETPITYTAFMPVNNEDQDFTNNPVWIKLQEMTNIYFEFISPIGGDESEEVLKRLFASGEYPDIVLNSTAGYSGGYAKAINDGIYIDIMPYVEENAPNYYSLLQEHKNLFTGIYTEDDQLPGFWEIYDPVNSISIIGGMTIRKDMLEQTGKRIPQTIDQWTEFMRAVKRIDTIEYPLIFGQQNGVNVTAEFLSAYGIGAAPISIMNSVNQLFYPVEGEIRYGAIENGYKEYLLQMNQWYEEGLLDKDFGVRSFTDLFERNSLITSGKAAANWQYLEWMSAYKGEDGELVEMVAAPMPKLSVDDENVMWMVSRKPYIGKVVSITTECEEIVPLIQFFDFLYSEEGMMLQNYGIEGDTYTMVDGRPIYTTKIIDYSKGPFEGVGKYINNNSAVFYDLIYTDDVQSQLYGQGILEMRACWLDSVELFSMNFELTVEENTQLVKIMSGITNYVTEYSIKAIIDKEVALNWEEYVKVIESMRIEEALEIMQMAYDRQRRIESEITP